jgi:hypothetical protein
MGSLLDRPRNDRAAIFREVFCISSNPPYTTALKKAPMVARPAPPSIIV